MKPLPMHKTDHAFIPFGEDGRAYYSSGKVRVYRSIEHAEKCGFTAKELVEYAPVRHGRWMLGESGVMYRCSECAYAAHPREVEEWWCCPRCGARMDGENNDEE